MWERGPGAKEMWERRSEQWNVGPSPVRQAVGPSLLSPTVLHFLRGRRSHIPVQNWGELCIYRRDGPTFLSRMHWECRGNVGPAGSPKTRGRRSHIIKYQP